MSVPFSIEVERIFSALCPLSEQKDRTLACLFFSNGNVLTTVSHCDYQFSYDPLLLHCYSTVDWEL